MIPASLRHEPGPCPSLIPYAHENNKQWVRRISAQPQLPHQSAMSPPGQCLSGGGGLGVMWLGGCSDRHQSDSQSDSHRCDSEAERNGSRRFFESAEAASGELRLYFAVHKNIIYS